MLFNVRVLTVKTVAAMAPPATRNGCQRDDEEQAPQAVLHGSRLEWIWGGCLRSGRIEFLNKPLLNCFQSFS